MRCKNWLILAISAALLGAPVLPAQATGEPPAGSLEKIGRVHFPISCSPQAQSQFDRAVALLHSFWFEAAREAFAGVIKTDPTCAMGHWGTAMTLLGNPLAWPPATKALADGWAAVQKADLLDAKTQRERDYIAAIGVFYRDFDKLDHRTRAVAYEKAMEQLAARYPEDREAAVFYALALNATALPTDKTYAQQLKAAAILEQVFAEQPEHPGVAHYLIHSYDYPPLAKRGLPAARRYASIAPAAPHALHMPSHTFTREGLWQESIQSNLASRAAAKNQFDQLHAMDYLVYAYLQGAQDRAARSVVEERKAIDKVSFDHFVVAYALSAIPARYALERGQWGEAAALGLHPGESDFAWKRYPQAEAITVFARALGAARGGDATAARKDIEKLKTLREAMIAAKMGYWIEQTDIQIQVASAWTALAEDKDREAVALLRSAADREDATEKHPVTPGPLAPARELLGEMLLRLNQPAQALKEFEASQRVEPNRFRSLYGAARSAELAADPDKAKTYYAQLVAICDKADTERPELKQARAFLARK